MESPPSLYRYERKFLLPAADLAEALGVVRSHPALFRQTFPPRAVNNLYLDTPSLAHYVDHVSGIANRMKIRIRWYGAFTGEIDRPVLEFKLKRGLVSRKESHRLPPFGVNGAPLEASTTPALLQAAMPPAARLSIQTVQPSLANRYQRHYFESADGHFRLTIDSSLEFCDPRHAGRSPFALLHDGPSVILELKYAPAHAAEADRIARAIPCRLARCSKYILGIEAIAAA
jgi:hypothetical protein